MYKKILHSVSKYSFTCKYSFSTQEFGKKRIINMYMKILHSVSILLHVTILLHASILFQHRSLERKE